MNESLTSEVDHQWFTHETGVVNAAPTSISDTLVSPGYHERIAPQIAQTMPTANTVEAASVESMNELYEMPASTPNMTEPLTRPELDAKLETIEARMDARIVRIESLIEGIHTESVETRKDIKSMKATVVTTAVAAVIAIVLGIAAFNAALTSNMLTAFQVGQQTAQHK